MIELVCKNQKLRQVDQRRLEGGRTPSGKLRGLPLLRKNVSHNYRGGGTTSGQYHLIF